MSKLLSVLNLRYFEILLKLEEIPYKVRGPLQTGKTGNLVLTDELLRERTNPLFH